MKCTDPIDLGDGTCEPCGDCDGCIRTRRAEIEMRFAKPDHGFPDWLTGREWEE